MHNLHNHMKSGKKNIYILEENLAQYFVIATF